MITSNVKFLRGACSLLLLLSMTQYDFMQALNEKQKQSLVEKYQNVIPTYWGEDAPGVKTRLKTTEKVVALTLDACGSEGDACDYRYVNFLIEHHIPATIFVSNRWIKKHSDDFKRLTECPLFDIQNHGLTHLPCSVNGKSIYNIPGTKNVAEIIREIDENATIIEKLTGKKSCFYRSGTAYYDEVAVKVVNDLGHQVIGFEVLGDAGATYSKDKVTEALLTTKPGSIIILHMNKPNKECALGAIEGMKVLLARDFKFVKLSDYELE